MSRPIRLRDHELDFMAGGMEGSQRRHGERRRTRKNYLERRLA
jgi:hypothetical protein